MPEPHDYRASAADSGSGLPWTLRPVDDTEFATFTQVVGEALHSQPADPDQLEFRRALTHLDRSLGAFDGSQLIGTALVHPFTMTLPGGPRPVAGVSAVGVWPTHRRRGVLTALMRRQLADIRDHGENVAALFASEGGIYERFGYGEASRAGSATLRRNDAALRGDVPRDRSMRLRMGAPDDFRAELATVHRAAAGLRVGEFQRDDAWWNAILRDPPERHAGFRPLTCAIAENDAGSLGYVLYRTRQGWDEHGLPDSLLKVHELYATTPAATTLLWEHVLGRDLVTTVTRDMLPLDDPLFRLLADHRHARTTLDDGLWIRLVDLPAAMEQRGYSTPVNTVLEVTDRTCPWNAGRWRLTVKDRGDTARCTPTDDTPDMHLDIAQLGAAYLGSVRLSPYVAAGLISEETEGAVARLDTALTVPTQPYCGVIF